MENRELNEFMKNQMALNNEITKQQNNLNISNINLTKIMESIKKNSIDTITTQVNDMQIELKNVTNTLKNIQIDNDNLKRENEQIKKDMNEIKDKTDVLEFEDRKTLGEIKKEAKARLVHKLGGTSTPQYILFFRTCISNLYGNIIDQLTGGKSLGKIKVEDGKVAITLAKRYQLNKKLLTKKYQEYQKMQMKGILDKEKENALDLVEEWMEDLR